MRTSDIKHLITDDGGNASRRAVPFIDESIRLSRRTRFLDAPLSLPTEDPRSREAGGGIAAANQALAGNQDFSGKADCLALVERLKSGQ